MCSAGVTSSKEARCEQLTCMLCGQQIEEGGNELSDDMIVDFGIKEVI
jgi:hypothetical protein